MSKITDYFYIFSKLTTSLVLLIIIFFMGYGIYKSYKGIDDTNLNLENKIISLSDSLSQNNNNLININEKLNSNDLLIEELKKLVINNNKNLEKENYQTDIKNLLKLNKQLQDQINEINNNLLTRSNKDLLDSNIINKSQFNDIKNIIYLKFNNGDKITEEIKFLESISPPAYNHIFEKLYLYEINQFQGMLNLNFEFDQSMKNFIKTNISSDKNYIIKFLLKFVSIRPNNVNNYEQKEIDIIMRAKNLMDSNDLEKSLNQILLLGDNKIFFNKWMAQVNIYLDFYSELNKVN